jgi:hypothetical protein
MSEPEHQQIILDDKFMGTKEPMWYLPKEQPWHRAAAFAFALGATCKDVARRLEKSEPAVQNLLRQKWFQKDVTSIMAEYGARDVMELFRAEQFNSLTTLIELRDNPKVPSSSRIACARDILDRALGKPVQRIEATQVTSSEDPCAEVERLEQEVGRMRRDNTVSASTVGCELERNVSETNIPIAAGETDGIGPQTDGGNGHHEAHNA